MEDSPGLEVRAHLDSGALRDGLRCVREGEVGPTRVWYLIGARAAVLGGWEAGAAEGETTATLPSAAVGAAAGCVAAAGTVAGG